MDPSGPETGFAPRSTDPSPRPSSSSSPLITVEKVSVEFGPQRVLHEITLPVQRGQTLVVIGESGCGKTVLLKLLIGLLRPTAGRVTFDRRVLTDLGEREL